MHCGSFLSCWDTCANMYIGTIVFEYLAVRPVHVKTCDLRLLLYVYIGYPKCLIVRYLIRMEIGSCGCGTRYVRYTRRLHEYSH